MIELAIASAIFAAAFQSTAADNARTALRNCIKQATTEAKAQKVAGAAFPAFVRQKCAAQESSFKSAVWAFDSKNKVSKKQSESDANLQVEDFVTSAADRYAMESAPQ
jgi:Tfp pilus assembly protein FimT